MSEKNPRPGHTTLAGAFVIGGAVGVVFSVGEQLSGLNSLETREQVSTFLTASPGAELGLTVSSALAILRVLLMVLAGCATAAAVLGFHALRRSTGARLGLSFLAFPIFFVGVASGGVLTALVAAGTMMMWIGPSAYWFRGEPVPTPPRPRQGGEVPPLPMRRPGASRPPQAPGTTLTAPRPDAQPDAHPAGPVATEPVRRPDALVWACVLTWAFSALAAVVMGASVVLIATSPDLVIEEMQRQGNDLGDTAVDTITDAVYLSASVVVAWSLLASFVAVLAFRGVSWGRSGLLASAAVAAVISLLGVVATVIMVLPAAAALVTVVLLNRPEVRAWCTGPRGPMQP